MNNLSFDIIGRDMAKGAFASVSSGFDAVERRAQRFAGVAVDSYNAVERAARSAARAEDISAYGAELDRLRAKYNPLFAASKAYEDELNEINRAHAVGAISASEQSMAISALNTRYQQAAESGKRLAGVSKYAGMMQRQLSFQLVDIGQALATAPTMGIYALQNLGFQIAQIGQLYAGNGGFTAAVKDSAAMVGRFAARMGPLAVAAAAVTAGILGMQHAINETSKVQVTFGDVALGVFQTVRDGLYNLIKPGIDSLAPWFKLAWDGVVAITKAQINFMVGGFVGAFGAIKAVWSGLPATIGGVVISAANNTLAGVESLINGAIKRIRSLNDMLPKWAQSDLIRGMGSVNLPKLDNPFAGAAADLGSSIFKAFDDAAKTDFAGGFFELVKGNAISNAIDRAKESAKKASTAMSEMARQALGGLKSYADEINAQVQEARRWVGQAADYMSDRIGDFFDNIQQGQSAWESLRNVALGVLQDISRALIRSNIQTLFGNLFGSAIQSPLQTGIPLFAGGFAGGGTIPAGMFGIAGEAGQPEIISGPATVTPVSKLGNAGGGNLNVTVRAYFDGGGELKAMVEEVSGRVAGQAIRYASPQLASGAVSAAQASFRNQPTRWK